MATIAGTRTMLPRARPTMETTTSIRRFIVPNLPRWLPSTGYPTYHRNSASSDRGGIHTVTSAQIFLRPDHGCEPGSQSDPVEGAGHNASLEACFRDETTQPTIYDVLLDCDNTSRLATRLEYGFRIERANRMGAQHARFYAVRSESICRLQSCAQDPSGRQQGDIAPGTQPADLT